MTEVPFFKLLQEPHWTKNFWDKYWSIIIALIAGFIIGALIFPKFFR
jgi:hypothetical protein